jgi:hypothetical protein
MKKEGSAFLSIHFKRVSLIFNVYIHPYVQFLEFNIAR